jgi:hypothetical protein
MLRAFDATVDADCSTRREVVDDREVLVDDRVTVGRGFGRAAAANIFI